MPSENRETRLSRSNQLKQEYLIAEEALQTLVAVSESSKAVDLVQREAIWSQRRNLVSKKGSYIDYLLQTMDAGSLPFTSGELDVLEALISDVENQLEVLESQTNLPIGEGGVSKHEDRGEKQASKKRIVEALKAPVPYRRRRLEGLRNKLEEVDSTDEGDEEVKGGGGEDERTIEQELDKWEELLDKADDLAVQIAAKQIATKDELDRLIEIRRTAVKLKKNLATLVLRNHNLRGQFNALSDRLSDLVNKIKEASETVEQPRDEQEFEDDPTSKLFIDLRKRVGELTDQVKKLPKEISSIEDESELARVEKFARELKFDLIYFSLRTVSSLSTKKTVYFSNESGAMISAVESAISHLGKLRTARDESTEQAASTTESPQRILEMWKESENNLPKPIRDFVTVASQARKMIERYRPFVVEGEDLSLSDDVSGELIDEIVASTSGLIGQLEEGRKVVDSFQAAYDRAAGISTVPEEVLAFRGLHNHLEMLVLIGKVDPPNVELGSTLRLYRNLAWERRANEQFSSLMQELDKAITLPEACTEDQVLSSLKSLEEAAEQLGSLITQVEKEIPNWNVGEEGGFGVRDEEKSFLFNDYLSRARDEVLKREKLIEEFLFKPVKYGNKLPRITLLIKPLEPLAEELVFLSNNSPSGVEANKHFEKLGDLITDAEKKLIEVAEAQSFNNAIVSRVHRDYIERAQKYQEQLYEVRAIPKGSQKLVVDFLEKYGRANIKDFDLWQRIEQQGIESELVSAKDILQAVWDFIEIKIFDIIGSRGTDFFFTVDILGLKLPMEHDPNIAFILDSMLALGDYFIDLGQVTKGELLKKGAGKMFAYASEMQTIMQWGNDLYGRRKSFEALKKFGEEFAFDALDLERLFGIGLEWQGSKGCLGNRIGRAWQTIEAMNAPIVYPVGVRFGGLLDGNVRFVRNIKEKSPHAFFPIEMENKGDDFARHQYVSDVLIQIIAGADESPPWMQIIADNKTYNYEARMFAARKYVEWRVYGDPQVVLNENDALAVMSGKKSPGGRRGKPHPQSMFNRFIESGARIGSTEWLTQEEQEAKNNGFVARSLAFNLYYVSFDFARASGGKMMKMAPSDGRLAQLRSRGYEVRVVDDVGEVVKDADKVGYLQIKQGDVWYYSQDTSTGTLGEVLAERLTCATTYRAKLAASWGKGADGVVGIATIQSIDSVYETLPTASQAYRHHFGGASDFEVVPYDKTRYMIRGRNLGEELMLAQDGDFPKLPYSLHIGGTNRNVRYKSTMPMAVDMYDWIIKGLGINWTAITSTMKGSEATPVFNQRELEKVMKLSRNVYYLLTRDYSYQIMTWKTDKDYRRYKAIEDWAYRQADITPDEARGGWYGQVWHEVFKDKDSGCFNNNIRIQHNGEEIHVSQEDYETFLICNSFVGAPGEYDIFDARPTKTSEEVSSIEDAQQIQSGYTRYATNVHNAYRIATMLPPEAEKNAFEQAVIANEKDEYRLRKKLIIGLFLINDITPTITGFSWDDIVAIVEFLSYEYWEARNQNRYAKRLRKMFNRPEREYNGLGLFSKDEAFALLKAAGVDTGITSRITAYSERLKRVPGIS